MSDKFEGKYHEGVIELDTDCSYFDHSELFGRFVCTSGAENHLAPTGTVEDLKEAVVKLPVYMMVHSSTRINPESFGCPFDSWQWGFICASDKEIRAYFDLKEDDYIDDFKVKKELLASIAIVDSFLSGEVYSYTVTNKLSGEAVDMLGGITTYEDAKHQLDEAIKIADKEYEEREFPLLVVTGTLED